MKKRNIDNEENFSLISYLIMEYNNEKNKQIHIVCSLCIWTTGKYERFAMTEYMRLKGVRTMGINGR